MAEQSRKPSMSIARGVKAGLSFAVFVLVVLFLGMVIKTQFLADGKEIEEGSLSPVVYIGLLAGCSLTAFTPAMPVALLGGRLFGLWQAAVYTFLGGGLGMMIAYVVGRWGGRPWVSLVLGEGKLASLEHRLHRALGFRTILILRLFPHPLYDAVSYLCGVVKVRLRTYFIASLLGAGPGCILFPWIGERIVKGGLVLAVMIWIVTAVLLYGAGRLHKRRSK